jgi:hypothetical protein
VGLSVRGRLEGGIFLVRVFYLGWRFVFWWFLVCVCVFVLAWVFVTSDLLVLGPLVQPFLEVDT